MKVILKTRFSQQLRLISSMIIRYLIILFFFNYYIGFESLYIGYLWLALILLLFDIIPTVILYIQYLLINKKTIIIIDTELKNLKIKKESNFSNYSFDEIKSFKYYESFGRDSYFYSWEGFRYYIVEFHDNRTLIITCLLMNKIERNLEQLLCKKAEVHRTVYVFVRKRDNLSP